MSKGYDLAPGVAITVTRIVDEPALVTRTP
jgi:hypothetical protein